MTWQKATKMEKMINRLINQSINQSTLLKCLKTSSQPRAPEQKNKKRARSSDKTNFVLINLAGG